MENEIEEISDSEKLEKELKIIEEQNKVFVALEKKAQMLSDTLKCKVYYETFTLKDGKIIYAFFKEPNALTSAPVLDMLNNGQFYQAGLKLWSSCFMGEHSSSEIEKDIKYKNGLLPRLAQYIEAEAPDIKKN